MSPLNTACFRTSLLCLLGAVVALPIFALESTDNTILTASAVPRDGIVLTHSGLPPGIHSPADGSSLTFHARVVGGGSLDVQFVPDADRQDQGIYIANCGHAGRITIRLGVPSLFTGGMPGSAGFATSAARFGFVANPLTGVPSSLTFTSSGRTLTDFVWNDRVYDARLGAFYFRRAGSHPLLMSDGPAAAVVRVRGRYLSEVDKETDSGVEAVYDWYMFKSSPLVYVRANVRQRRAFAWAELHFLEFNFAGADFSRFAGGDPELSRELRSSRNSERFEHWGALTAGHEGVGMFGSPVTIYDGHGDYGTYLHSSWTPWSDREARFSAWIWAGTAADPITEIRAAAGVETGSRTAVVTTEALHQRIAELRVAQGSGRGAADTDGPVIAAVAERSERLGELTSAARLAFGKLSPNWTVLRSGDFGMALEKTGGAIELRSLCNTGMRRDLLGSEVPPIFKLELSAKPLDTPIEVTSRGWTSMQTVRTGPNRLELRWLRHSEPQFAGISVIAEAESREAKNAWEWKIRVVDRSRKWAVSSVRFPVLSLSEPGERSVLLYPVGPGVAQEGVWRKNFRYQGTYPSGWFTVQAMAAYGLGQGASGMFVGLLDPAGSVKDLKVEANPESRSLFVEANHPAPNLDRPGNGFILSGSVELRLLRGDWFDASQMYREWVARVAKWWPKTGTDGRPDTPLWMRELPAWALASGTSEEVVGPVAEFARYLGVPIGVHWYNWHGNPFDNDYPHYFPTKPGIAEGVRRLQSAGVHVMPYINGRLWDTRDRGTEDFEFTSRALPAATKSIDGKPFTESYGSKETDGSPVKLAVMCPTTKLWQETIGQTVARLFGEVGVDAVYIDQIGAAAPMLCADPAHSHPAGGGHWWNDGYWDLLGAIRQQKPARGMLTTECNAEPFAHKIDGFLTWHWQSDAMVPFFSAVYGGKVQMFGRSYGGGQTRDLALRMKAAQQLVFGEQIGWIGPEVVREKQNAEFLRRVIRLRYQFRRYFYAGTMQRPPTLTQPPPLARADWQWSGEDWVTADALQTGAWSLPREGRTLLLFANVGETAIQRKLTRLPTAYANTDRTAQVWLYSAPDVAPTRFKPGDSSIVVGPHQVIAIEIQSNGR